MRRNPTIRSATSRRPSSLLFQQRTRLIAVAAFALACFSLLVAGCACLQIGAAYAQTSSASAQASADAAGSGEEGLSDEASISDVSGVSAISLSVPSILQNPELPTGCEVTALAEVLQFWGFDVCKTELADEWLPRSESDFVNAFLGDPYSEDGHACMAPCIVQAASSYLSACESDLAATDMTGISFSEVLGTVANGTPVIVWVTIGLEEPSEPYLTQEEDGIEYSLFAETHCVAVIGFDAAAQTVLVADPLEGQVSYDIDLIALRYQQLGSQAVVIA